MRWDVGLNRKRVACFRFGRDVEEYEARLMVREERRGEERRGGWIIVTTTNYYYYFMN